MGFLWTNTAEDNGEKSDKLLVFFLNTTNVHIRLNIILTFIEQATS